MGVHKVFWAIVWLVLPSSNDGALREDKSLQVNELKAQLRLIDLKKEEEMISGLQNHESKPILSRSKRTAVVWPTGSKFTSEFSIEVPIHAPEGVRIPFTIEVPYSFVLPSAHYNVIKGRSAKSNRIGIYSVVEGIFQRFGLNGKNCLERAICERAETHFLTDGLLGEILNLLLTVSIDNGGEELYNYLRAEYAGKLQGNCSYVYNECPISLFHWFDV